MRSHRAGSVGVAAAVFFAALCLPASGLELTSGPLKLTLYEGRGRFSLASQARAGTGSFVPLLAAEDPRTSRLDVVAGNKIYTMGESPEFQETVEKVGSGARFVWKSSFLQVTETFTFVPSSGSSVTGGVRIDLSLRNLSNQDVAIGVRYILDTYLGEASFVHFRTDSLTQVTHELTLTPADKTPWWVSPLPSDPDSLGFQVMTAGAGVTPPDRVIFANWKRLTDSSWSYDSSAVRTFSLLPYSVNDSAAGQYYDPRTIARGGEALISLVMGRYSRNGLSTAIPETANVATGASSSTSASNTVAGSTAAVASPAVVADLTSVDGILAEIDAALAAGTPLTSERLAAIESALKDLSGRAPGYSSGSGR
jgi:hypothetical protein